jgi:outer membrane protein OmpA-like peptidoglycan-associated protein/tetratricopeptide (TPR) repeat protein
MKKFIILMAMISLVFGGFGQDTKKIKQLFQEAEQHLLYEEYELALPKYLEMMSLGWDNSNIAFNIGICYLNVDNQFVQAIPYLEKATQKINPDYREGNYKEDGAPEEAWFYLGKAYRLNGQYDKAAEAYGQYKSSLNVSDVYYIDFVNLQIESCENARKLMASPIPLNKVRPSFLIEGETYYPAIAGDEKSVVYTSYQKVKDPVTREEGFFELIYYSTFENGEWKKPQDITYAIASDGDFSTASLSYHGDFMILYRDDFGNGNLYYSKFEDGRWTEIDKMQKTISSKYNETHGSLSKDGKTLYFSSDRPGGVGELDIYKSVLDESGNWGLPVNLGETINSKFGEDTPFLAEDDRTLFFASEAHSSIGGYDVFKSIMDDNGNWSEPQNLGYPINTPNDDIYYLPIGDGSVGYMTKFPDGGGPKQIFKLDKNVVVEPVVNIAATQPENTDDLNIDQNSGNLATDETNTQSSTTETPVVTQTYVPAIPSEYSLKGRLSLQDNKDIDNTFYIHVTKTDGEVVAALSPDIATGEFATKIKSGTYKVKAYGQGYQPAEKMISITPGETNPDVLTFMSMVPEAVSSGEYYSIKSILFDYNSAQLNRNGQIEVERLAVLMDKNPSLKVEVVGNTDAMGTDEFNQDLSIHRARQVVEYLRKKNIPESRFVTKGLGKSNFIAINQNPDGSDNPEGRRLNRRVDIKIVNSGGVNITVENIYVPDELRYKDQLTYTIWLMETDKPLAPSYFSKSGESINNVWMFQTDNNGYLYTVGLFHHQAEALTLMNKVVDAGFPDAKVISSLEYNQLIQKESNFYKAKMSEPDNGTYTIQLFALKKPLENPSYKGLRDVEMIQGKDGYYHYIWGEFIGKISAKQALDDVIAKGFYDAFVVEIDKISN